MELKDIWKKYEADRGFNLSVLPEEIRKTGEVVRFAPRQRIISKGDRVKYIYFIQSGKAIGQREYASGQEYTYFQADEKGGNLGLLEILSGNEILVASIVAVTEVTAVRIDAALILDMIMTDIHMLRRCTDMVARNLYKGSGEEGRFYYVGGADRIRHYLIERYGQMEIEAQYIRTKNREDANKEFCIDVRYQDIANATGLSVRTVGRCLKTLRDAEEIRSVRQKIYVGAKERRRLEEGLTGS